MNWKNKTVVIRGAGDIATGAIQKLHRSGFNVVALEIAKPAAIRRKVSLCEAVYDNTAVVEDITAYRADSAADIKNIFRKDAVAVLVDPECLCLKAVNPIALIDCIIAKKNYGTHKDMAKITIAAGPGFSAPQDVDVVVETNRGHNLGRLIFNGSASANTGTPGIIAGISSERVIYAQIGGVIENLVEIGDTVTKGQIIANIGKEPVYASIDGILRGIIRNGYQIQKGLKIADIDPRLAEHDNCFTISDKARSVGGAILEALLIKGGEI